MRRSAFAMLTLAAALAVPATVGAALPKIPKVNRTIVLGKSIAGVRLGDTLKRAKTVWGPGSKCTSFPPNTGCYWSGGKLGQLGATAKNGRIVTLTIQLGHKPGLGYYPAPLLSQVKLAGKIAVGTPVAKLKATYAFPVLNTTGNTSFSIYAAGHKVETSFSFDLDGKTEPIWAITLYGYS